MQRPLKVYLRLFDFFKHDAPGANVTKLLFLTGGTNELQRFCPWLPSKLLLLFASMSLTFHVGTLFVNIRLVIRKLGKQSRGHIFSRVRPFYERALSDLDRSMHRSLWA